MTYIDFDGTILDTEESLFYELRRIPDYKNLSEETKIKYIQSQDWNYIIKVSPVINDAIYYLKHMDPAKSAILTRVHSLSNEGAAKINWKKENNIKQSMIIVPYNVRKIDVVDARGNYLLDDGLWNLDEWNSVGGIPLFMDPDEDGYDPWGKPNINNYPKVKSLGEIYKYIL